MSVAVSTSRISCPVCGQLATLTIRNDFAAGRPARTSASLNCQSGCEPDSTELSALHTGSRVTPSRAAADTAP